MLLMRWQMIFGIFLRPGSGHLSCDKEVVDGTICSFSEVLDWGHFKIRPSFYPRRAFLDSLSRNMHKHDCMIVCSSAVCSAYSFLPKEADSCAAMRLSPSDYGWTIPVNLKYLSSFCELQIAYATTSGCGSGKIQNDPRIRGCAANYFPFSQIVCLICTTAGGIDLQSLLAPNGTSSYPRRLSKTVMIWCSLYFLSDEKGKFGYVMINHLIWDQQQSYYLTVVRDQLSAKKILHYYKRIWWVPGYKTQTLTVFILGHLISCFCRTLLKDTQSCRTWLNSYLTFIILIFHYTNKCVCLVEKLWILWAIEHHECTTVVKVDQRNRGKSSAPQQDHPKLDSAERTCTNKLEQWVFPPFVA